MLGDSSVGKSSIMLRHVRGKFEEKQKQTTGPEFSVHNSLIEGKMIKSQIWDTAGQEKFMAITKGYNTKYSFYQNFHFHVLIPFLFILKKVITEMRWVLF